MNYPLLFRFEKNKKKQDSFVYYFIFFSVFPVIVPGVNLSMFLFILLYIYFEKSNKINFTLDSIDLKFLFIFILSVSLGVFDIWTLQQGLSRILNGITVLPNYIYWFMIVIFFCKHGNRINFYNISKAAFWGLASSLIYFFVLHDLRNLPILSGLQQNQLSFLLIAYSPLSYLYVIRRWGKIGFFLSGVIFSILGFLTGSRSGSLLIMFGFISMIYYFYLRFNKKLKIMLLIFIPLITTISITNINHIDSVIQALNPRTRDLLFEKKILSKDPSFLTRLAIVEKGMNLFKRNPFTGIGLNNFATTNEDISFSFEGGKSIRHNKTFIQGASAHNSYLSILVETGLLGFIPFILFLLFNLLRFILSLNKMDALGFALFTGYIAMLIHMYFISIILNMYSWLFIGLCASYNYWNLYFTRPPEVKNQAAASF